MKKANIGLILLGAAGVGVLFIPNDFIKGAGVVTIVGTALVAALLKHLQDEAAFQRDILKAEQQQRFLIGASSHMATAAFDKHVEFCEAYVKEVHRTLGTLFEKGATEDALRHVASLAEIRRHYVLWLTPAIESKLDVFECALGDLGGAAGYVAAMGGRPIDPKDGEYHMQQIHKMHRRLREVMGMESFQGETLSKDAAASTAIGVLREILDTSALTELRSSIVKKAQEEVDARV